MINVVVSGCNGAMGRVLTKVIEEMEGMTIVAGIDKNTDLYKNNYPVYKSPSLVKEKCDVIIDFSGPSNISGLLEYAVNNDIAIVIATTGFSVNVLINLVKQATNTLGDIADIEIIEKHHNKKVDAPSGTAKMIAEAINKELDGSMEFSYGRNGTDAKREENEIGIHSIRGGTISGEHTVIFAGLDEIIEVKHTALSKKVFAQGSVKAAQYILNRKNGLYDMNSLINNN